MDQVVPVLVIVIVFITRRISTRHDDFGCFVQMCIQLETLPTPVGAPGCAPPNPANNCACCAALAPSAAAVLATSSSRISRAASNTLMRSPTEVISNASSAPRRAIETPRRPPRPRETARRNARAHTDGAPP